MDGEGRQSPHYSPSLLGGFAKLERFEVEILKNFPRPRLDNKERDTHTHIPSLCPHDLFTPFSLACGNSLSSQTSRSPAAVSCFGVVKTLGREATKKAEERSSGCRVMRLQRVSGGPMESLGSRGSAGRKKKRGGGSLNGI